MADKKQEIMDTAVQLFSKKGFHFTSIQEITEACGISKGAFYKHFSSKENMMLNLLEQFHMHLLQEADNELVRRDITPKELLIQRIELELRKSVEYHTFFHILFTEFFPTDDTEINQKAKQMRDAQRIWHCNALLEAFGGRVRPYVHDLTAMMEGMMKEYLGRRMWENHPLSLKDLAHFIYARLEVIVKHDEDLEPLLSEKEQVKDPMAKRDKMCLTLTRVMEDETIPFTEKDKHSIHLLLSELQQDTNQEFLVEALMMYLSRKDYLKETMSELSYMWREWKGE
ncbi:transcriptional regulator, TetR family [Alteribacillus persepolensis]|uniref:Transcriptional regulator, TetR family n=1 Tax=Alteribacillus persepolensis TaxID=568899 RepID=A0A1G8INZ1_9BACI|nr:TetR/AcrR family transcriptional regulator [Alteribacillus persepolensis]SDI20635.1 transcriptional regulator, TetR family [Alteribacillus persepolensis]